QQYYTFATANATMLTACGTPDMPRVFGTDQHPTSPATVELGPFAGKLWDRSDVVDRMRLVVQRHTLEPHQAAVPPALTRRPVGSPNAAGLGAHIQRARIDAGVARSAPYSYVLATGGISSDNVAAAASPGTHPGTARPLLIKTDNASTLTTLLGRP